MNGSTVEDLPVSNLSNDVPAPPDEPVNGANSNASPRVMLITLLLLIIGLLLTSTMMIHYANRQNNAQAKTKADHEEPSDLSLQVTSFLGKLNKQNRENDSEESASRDESNTGTGIVDQFFGSRSNSTRWPKLNLTGFGTSTDGSGGFAIINNHKYHVGDRISGKVTLLEIRKHNVLVECSGETKNLSVDTTN